MMTMEQDEVKEERSVNFTLFNIPEGDANYFREVMKSYGNRGAPAFRALLDAYSYSQQLGEILLKISLLQERIEKIEAERQKKMIKTFGGE